jgi:hypothetical protein
MQNESDKQTDNSRPWLWKKGQSGNLAGRPKGKTMKEWAKDYLSRMTDEERDEFMEGIDKYIVWKMAEGMPQTNTDITSGGKPIIQVSPEIAAKHAIRTDIKEIPE